METNYERLTTEFKNMTTEELGHFLFVKLERINELNDQVTEIQDLLNHRGETP